MDVVAQTGMSNYPMVFGVTPDGLFVPYEVRHSAIGFSITPTLDSPVFVIMRTEDYKDWELIDLSSGGMSWSEVEMVMAAVNGK